MKPNRNVKQKNSGKIALENIKWILSSKLWLNNVHKAFELISNYIEMLCNENEMRAARTQHNTTTDTQKKEPEQNCELSPKNE